MNKVLKVFAIFSILLIGIIGLMSSVSALESLLESLHVGDNVRVVQICDDATYVNISSIATPDGRSAVSNVPMVFSGNGEYYYNFNLTDTIGRYDVRGISDGCEGTFTYFFNVTPSGFADTLGFYILLIVLIVGVIILGFAFTDVWFIIIGGICLMVLGLYSINSGIAGFRDMFLTWGISLFEIFVGGYLTIKAGLETMEGVDG